MFSRLFKWGKSEKESVLTIPENADFAFLGADMHSHFVPGVDDGAKTIEDSLNLLRAMERMGYKKVITTPHVMIDFYPNTTKTITDGLDILRTAAKENGINLSINAAAEYYIDEYFMGLIEKEPLLTIHKNDVLVEFSMMYEPPMLNTALFNMQTSGYRPIIAHPERYMSFHKNKDKYHELRDRGCLLQMNLLSLTGYYGKNIMDIAEWLLENKMYDYCGSDMHHEKHAGALQHLLQSKTYTSIVNYPFLNSQLCF